MQQRCVNTIRGLAMDAVQQAQSGHPGMPMGMADVAFVIWTEFLKHNPSNPQWFDRDRFVLSAGHGSMLLYSLLHLTGYNLSLEQLKLFRQWESKTPGHPEYGVTEGVETTTGPLGQGLSNGVGFAIAESHLASRINTDDISVVDHYTYAIVSDGDLMEGISHEAASLAGHLKLGKLIYFYDDNGITIDGSTQLAFTEDVARRFEAYGWHCMAIDGHDREAIRRATKEAQKEMEKPSLILCKTHIGFGSPNKQDTADSHGAPLGDDEIRMTKEKLGLDPNRVFQIDSEVLSFYRQAGARGKKFEQAWHQKLDQLSARHPEKSELFHRCTQKVQHGIADILPEFEADPAGMATRKASGMVLDACLKALPNMIGGSADLTPSNNTKSGVVGIYSAEDRTGRYIHYGVREHAMWAAMNGIALHGGLRPYGGTFLIFSDYCRPSIRLAALSNIPTIGVFTHDSIGLGEDGPTHQPVEQLASLRAIPNLVVLRPCDANETACAWKVALERTNGPTLLALTRQALPTLDRRSRFASASLLEKGAYILEDAEHGEPDIILIGSGSEVQHIIGARELLQQRQIEARVVSMPSWELFRRQSEAYRASVLSNGNIPRISVEAGSSMGWKEWIGTDGVSISLDQFGASAPCKIIFEKLGYTPENIVEEVTGLLESIDLQR
ncbi:MAG: transketolase [Balneolales bacterium]